MLFGETRVGRLQIQNEKKGGGEVRAVLETR